MRPATVERAFYPEAEEAADRLQPQARRLERLDQLPGHDVLVALQSAEEEGPLVAEGSVEASALNAHMGNEVLDGGGRVPLGPEHAHGAVQDVLAIELLRSRHRGQKIANVERSVKNTQ